MANDRDDTTLKAKLKARGLSTDGTHKELLDRLMKATREAKQAEREAAAGGKAAAPSVDSKMSLTEKLKAKGLSTDGTQKEQFERLMNATREEKSKQREDAANPAAPAPQAGDMGVLDDEDPLASTESVAFPTVQGAEVTSCGVCKKEFAAAPEEQVPGLLVCGHSICKSCEEKLIEAAQIYILPKRLVFVPTPRQKN